jgi:hypothetical protein
MGRQIGRSLARLTEHIDRAQVGIFVVDSASESSLGRAPGEVPNELTHAFVVENDRDPAG